MPCLHGVSGFIYLAGKDNSLHGCKQYCAHLFAHMAHDLDSVSTFLFTFTGSLRLWPAQHSLCAAYFGLGQAAEPQRHGDDYCDARPAWHEPLQAGWSGRASLPVTDQRPVSWHRARQGRLPTARGCHTKKRWGSQLGLSRSVGPESCAGLALADLFTRTIQTYFVSWNFQQMKKEKKRSKRLRYVFPVFRFLVKAQSTKMWRL